MKKKKLRKEIERLNKLNYDLRCDIRTLLSEGKDLEKAVVKTKYDLLDKMQFQMWQGDSYNAVQHNGIIDLID
jgi:hypothetical protein